MVFAELSINGFSPVYQIVYKLLIEQKLTVVYPKAQFWAHFSSCFIY